MKCYKKLIYQQFVQASGLCGPQYWCTVLVHRYGRLKSTKTSGVHFFYKRSQITNNNFEISLVVFMPNITANHSIAYINNYFFDISLKVNSGQDLLLVQCSSDTCWQQMWHGGGQSSILWKGKESSWPTWTGILWNQRQGEHECQASVWTPGRYNLWQDVRESRFWSYNC